MKRSGEDIEAPQSKRPKLLRDTLGLPRRRLDVVQIYWSGYLAVRRQWWPQLGGGALNVLDTYCQEDEDAIIRIIMHRTSQMSQMSVRFVRDPYTASRIFFAGDVTPGGVCVRAFLIFCICSVATTMDVRLVLPKPIVQNADYGELFDAAEYVVPTSTLDVLKAKRLDMLKCIFAQDVLFQDAKKIDHPVLWIVVSPALVRNPLTEKVTLHDSLLIVHNPPFKDRFGVHGYVTH